MPSVLDKGPVVVFNEFIRNIIYLSRLVFIRCYPSRSNSLTNDSFYKMISISDLQKRSQSYLIKIIALLGCTFVLIFNNYVEAGKKIPEEVFSRMNVAQSVTNIYAMQSDYVSFMGVLACWFDSDSPAWVQHFNQWLDFIFFDDHESFVFNNDPKWKPESAVSFFIKITGKSGIKKIKGKSGIKQMRQPHLQIVSEGFRVFFAAMTQELCLSLYWHLLLVYSEFQWLSSNGEPLKCRMPLPASITRISGELPKKLTSNMAALAANAIVNSEYTTHYTESLRDIFKLCVRHHPEKEADFWQALIKAELTCGEPSKLDTFLDQLDISGDQLKSSQMLGKLGCALANFLILLPEDSPVLGMLWLSGRLPPDVMTEPETLLIPAWKSEPTADFSQGIATGKEEGINKIFMTQDQSTLISMDNQKEYFLSRLEEYLGADNTLEKKITLFSRFIESLLLINQQRIANSLLYALAHYDQSDKPPLLCTSNYKLYQHRNRSGWEKWCARFLMSKICAETMLTDRTEDSLGDGSEKTDCPIIQAMDMICMNMSESQLKYLNFKWVYTCLPDKLNKADGSLYDQARVLKEREGFAQRQAFESISSGAVPKPFKAAKNSELEDRLKVERLRDLSRSTLSLSSKSSSK